MWTKQEVQFVIAKGFFRKKTVATQLHNDVLGKTTTMNAEYTVTQLIVKINTQAMTTT